MKRILLIYEDIGESTAAQSILRKMGFDAFSINNINRLSDQIITFNPELIVVYGKQKFPGIQVCQKLKEMSHLKSKVLLIMPHGERPHALDMPKARIDMILEGPLVPEQLVLASAKLLGIAPEPFMEKFKKVRPADEVGTAKAVLGQKSTSAKENTTNHIHGKITFDDKVRVSKYQKFLVGIKFDLKETTHNHEAIVKKQSELKKEWDFDFLGQLDKLKRQFVDALFKKK